MVHAAVFFTRQVIDFDSDPDCMDFTLVLSSPFSLYCEDFCAKVRYKVKQGLCVPSKVDSFRTVKSQKSVYSVSFLL